MDYSAPRFPMGVAAFRARVKTDLTTMSSNGLTTVDFDGTDKASINPGELDRRTANAVYDNIVPGPATLDGTYPLQELYALRLGRDELRPGRSEVDPSVNPSVRGKNANVHGFFDDGLPMVNAVPQNYTSRVDSGYSSYDPGDATDLGGGLPSGPGAKQGEVQARWLHLRPKGMDIAASTAPNGPYDKVTDVPYRQLGFGPDWFSTELTTTSTCYILVITAQLVDAKSVDTDPANPARHREIFFGQWGCCVEIAPDVMVEPGLGGEYAYWYRNGKPAEYKKAALDSRNADNVLKSMDQFCSTLKTLNALGRQWKRSSIARAWSDDRGITEANRAAYYTGATQTRKHVVVKAVWSLNQSQAR